MNEPLVLVRKASDVYFNDKKLTISAQASKGVGNEVVKIDGLPNSNGKKWLSLSLLKEGSNEVQCTARVVTSQIGKPATAKVLEPTYRLNADEVKKVEALQAKIDAIIQVAKDRYVPRPRIDLNPAEMTEEERQAEIAKWTAYLGLSK